MNILIAADYATPASGNFVASCVELGRTLNKCGDSVSFVFPENANTLSCDSWVHWLEKENFNVYLTPPRNNISSEQVLTFLKSVIEKDKIDILHIHFGMFHNEAVTHAKELGVKILIHDHMDFAAGANLIKQKIRCALQSVFYRKNNVAVISVNPQKDSAYVFSKHYYVPNGLSLIRNITRSETREEVRTALQISSEEKLCLFLGWDVHRKGLDIAVKAVNEIRKEKPNVILGIVGLGDPPSSERLRFIQDSTGISPDSSWIKYLPSREDMFAYHRSADVYLSASRSEAFSYGILEAISQNTPVVVSDIKGTSWCHSYSKSVVYSTEDYKACANAICHALTLGYENSNADEIVQSYSIKKWCQRIIDIYKTI